MVNLPTSLTSSPAGKAEATIGGLGPAPAKSFKAIREMGGKRSNRYSGSAADAPTSHIVFGAKDAGKAQPLHSRILTPTGWTTMGEIEVGDIIIAGDGTPTEVTGVFHRGVKPIYRITFDDGSSAECCDEHLWSVRNYVEHSQDGPFHTMELKDFMDNLTTPGGISRWRIPIVGAVQYEGGPLPVDPYVLGALIGDGSLVSHTPIITNPDDEIMDRVAKSLPDGIVANNLVGESYRCGAISLSKAGGWKAPGGGWVVNTLTASLRELGLMGTHSYDKFIPRLYLTAGIADRIELLRGLMDTDGWVGRVGQSPVYTTTSPRLRDDVVELVRSLGGTAMVNKKRKPFYRNVDGEKVFCRDAYNVSVRMPVGINPFFVKRKAEAFVPPSKYQPTRIPKSVDYVGDMPARCIMVDHPDHLYVTDDYIVTHNSAWPCLFMEKGVRNVVRTFDFTTEKSLRETMGNQWIEEHHVQFDTILRPDPVSGYPGLDYTRPETAIEVYAECIAALEEERDAGDVGTLLMDHFQQAYEKVCAFVAYISANVDPLNNSGGRKGNGMEFADWRPRTEAAQALEQLVRSVPKPGGHAFITGYGAAQKWAQEPSRDPKRKFDIVRKPKWPVWLGWDGEISRDYDITWELSTQQSRPEGHRAAGSLMQTRYFATVFSSKIRSRFPVGATLDWTHKFALGELQPQLDAALGAAATAAREAAQSVVEAAPDTNEGETE